MATNDTRNSAAARHPARRRGSDALLAVPRMAAGGPAPLMIGGEPPYLKQLAGPAAPRALPAPGVNTAGAFGPSLNTAAALGSQPPFLKQLTGPRTAPTPTAGAPLALPKPAGVINLGMDAPPAALPPGTGQINLGMDADAGFRTVPRGAPGEPTLTGYEGVNWGPQNPKPGPSEMGATMGAYDRLNQARAASAAEAAAAQPAAPTAQPGGVGTALGIMNVLRKGPRGIPYAVATAAENQLHGAAYGGQTPGWIQAVEQDAAKLGQWAQRGTPMSQEDLMAALPGKHTEILARDAAEKLQAKAQEADSAKALAKFGAAAPAATTETAAKTETAKTDPLAMGPQRPYGSVEWVGSVPPATARSPQTTAPAPYIGGVMSDAQIQAVKDYARDTRDSQAVDANGPMYGVRGHIGGGTFEIGSRDGAALKRVMDSLNNGGFERMQKDNERVAALQATPEFQAQRAASIEEYQRDLAAGAMRNDMVDALALPVDDQVLRSGLVQAARDRFGATMQAGEMAAAQKREKAQLEAGVEQKRIESQGKVAEKQAEARKPVAMKYKVGGKRPGDDPLDQEVLYDPLTQQPLFDTGSVAGGAGAAHPFGAFEDRPDEWEALAKTKGYGSGRAAYQAAVQAWMNKYSGA